MFVFLYYYEWRVERIRKVFLKNMEQDQFFRLLEVSISSVSNLLTLSSVVLSIWVGFGILAPHEIIAFYGEDIFMINATITFSLVFFAITLYIHHLCHYFNPENIGQEKILEVRKDLFLKASTFFIFGTVFFLLSFLYSFVIISVMLSPPLDCLAVVVIFGVVAISMLVFLAVKKLWYVLDILRQI